MGVKYLPSDGIVVRQGIYQESLTQNADLGRFIDLEDGRRYRYCKAEGAIAKGHLCQSAAIDGNHNYITQTNYTLAIGDKDDINVLMGGTIVKNDYAEGFLVINNDTGEGEMYKVRKNSSAYSPCVISLYDEIRVATAATSEASLIQNKYRDVIIVVASAQPTGVLVGVPNIAVTTGGYFFWAQTKGFCAVQIETAATAGIDVTIGDNTTDGSVELRAAITDLIVGTALYSADADLDYIVIDLRLE